MIERIEKVLLLTSANPAEAKEIVSIHKQLFGSMINVCSHCPDQLRLALERIKKHYERTKRQG